MLQSLKEAVGSPQLNDLLGELLNKTEEILQQMETAVREGDFAGLAARAHELKGMAGNFGMVEASSIAAHIEKKIKNSEPGDVSGLVQSLPAASARARAAIETWMAE